MKQLFTTLFLVFFLVHAHAQYRSDTLDNIQISDNRISTPYARQARNVQVITQKEILELPVKSISEVLQYLAGVDIRQRGPWGAQADVSIDGSTSDEVLVLVNGVKMSDPQTGHHLLNLPIPLNDIDHIEVLHGPAARVYGVNALAGAINIVTRHPQENEVSGEVYAGSSFKKDTSTGKTYTGWGAQASGTLAGKNQSHTFSIGHDESNGYRYNTANNAYKLFYQNQIKLSNKAELEAMAGYISNHFGASLFYAAPNDVEAVETVQSAIGSVAVHYKPSATWTITPRISYRYNKDDYIYIRQNPDVYHNVHETNVATGEVQASHTIRNGVFGMGVEVREEAIHSNNLGNHQRNNTGIYAEYKHYFSDRLSANIGLYGNYNEDYGLRFFPGIDAGYLLTKDLRLFVNAGTGQRLPTYTDLYYKGPTNIGNDQLRPELASFAEGGIAYNKKAFHAQVSYSYRHITDFIDWVRSSVSDPWQPQNFQSINTQSISVRADYDLSHVLSLAPQHQLKFYTSYTYLNPAIELPAEGISKYATEALRHQFMARLQSTLWKTVELTVSARYQQRINAADYTVVDAHVGYNIKSFTIYVDGNNLFDKVYQEIGTIPLPGRWVAAGVRFSKF